jgi:hypothetical protein
VVYAWTDVAAVGSMPDAAVAGGQPASVGGPQADTGDTI